MHPGVLHAGLAYVIWGLFPLYFKQLAAVAPLDVLVHRVVWSLAFLLLVLTVRRQWAWLRDVITKPRALALFALSALLLSGNWLTYIWAVTNDHVLDASLGYFITPLVNVLLGYSVLRERLRPIQWSAVALAAAGVLWLALQGTHLPWIALVLAFTFGAYGLMRKLAALGALEGLALETMMLAPAALALLWIDAARGHASFPADSAWVTALLVGIGPVTAVPLLLFASGARQISMTTLGVLQYLAPSIQFLLGVAIFREPFSAERLVGFGLIWSALVLYSLDGWRRQGAPSPMPAMEPE